MTYADWVAESRATVADPVFGAHNDGRGVGHAPAARPAVTATPPPAPDPLGEDRHGDPRYMTISDYCDRTGRYSPRQFSEWSRRWVLNGSTAWLGRIGNEPAIHVAEFEAWIARCGHSL